MKKLLQPLTLLRSIIIIALLVVIPFAGFYLYAVNRPVAFGDSYYRGLQIKYDRLTSVKGPKVVVIGGSAAAFAIDSDLMEKETGMPVINFGLYAAIGFKPMMDLALPHLGKGDIVILMPELSAQTYSDYVGYEYLLYTMEGRSDMAFDFGIDYAKYFLNKYPSYLKNAKKALSSSQTNTTVYAYSSFSSNGDLSYDRPENVMSLGFSPDNLPEVTTDIITDDFVSMVNSFTRTAEKKGASVYFSFPPINAMSVSSVSEADYREFSERLSQKLTATVCSDLHSHVLNAGYFYDSNYHVNNVGSVCFSLLLSNDIKRINGAISENFTAIPTPLPMLHGDAMPVTVDGFTGLVSEGNITITGVTDDMKLLSSITIPDTLGPDSYKVTSLSGAVFDGCTALTEIIIHCEALPEVGNYLLSGVNENIKIKVPEDLYTIYLTDYFWGYYSDNLVSE